MSTGKDTNVIQNGRVEAAEVEVKALPDTPAHAGGRRYSQAYKLRILAEADRCVRGELGALLRREGLYYSTLSKWRQQQAAGRLDGSAQQQQAAARAAAQEVGRLQRENARLKKELAQAEAIIAVQKKVAKLLEAFEK